MQDFLSSIATNPWLRGVGGVFSLTLLAWATNVVARQIFLRLVQRVARSTQSTWDDRLIERRVFHKLANVAPALVTYVGIGWALGVGPDILADAPSVDLQGTSREGLALAAAILVRRVSLAWVVIALTTVAGGLLNALNDVYAETYAEARNRPIKGYLQVISLFLYVMAGILVVSVLAGLNPVVFLSGLGALTAILMLVFRDTILSLVASVQIMFQQHDQHRGLGRDAPVQRRRRRHRHRAAHGEDPELGQDHLHHPHAQVHLRVVPELAGNERVRRSAHQTGDPPRHEHHPLPFGRGSGPVLPFRIPARLPAGQAERELKVANDREGPADDVVPDQRRLTNVGTFRAYVLHYLRNHPTIHQDMTLLVRQLQPGSQGLPLEIYCFSNDTDWGNYEALQADIFDHLIASLPEFGLEAFQEPTGGDLKALRPN